MGLGIGYTSYECACGGMITECWDRISIHVQCDSCEDPIPKDLSVENIEDRHLIQED